MESRTVQKVGAATLGSSLPENWVTQRRLKRGGRIFLVEEGVAPWVLPSLGAEKRKRSAVEFTVDADPCEEAEMLENTERDALRLFLRESLGGRAQQQSILLPLSWILRGTGKIGGYGRFNALNTYNRYLEKPSNLCRPTPTRG